MTVDRVVVGGLSRSRRTVSLLGVALGLEAVAYVAAIVLLSR